MDHPIYKAMKLHFPVHICSSGVFLEHRTIVLAAAEKQPVLFDSVEALNASLLLSRVRMTGQSSTRTCLKRACRSFLNRYSGMNQAAHKAAGCSKGKAEKPPPVARATFLFS